MIDFACKQFKIEEVVKCGLGLTRAEFDVLKYLMQKSDEQIATGDLAESLKLNLSTIQRTMKKLFEKGVAERSQTNLAGGGYVFAYRISDKDKIRNILSKTVHAWVGKVDEELNKW